MTKLAIVEDREEDKYDHVKTVKCWKCDRQRGTEVANAEADPKVCIHLRNGYLSLNSVPDHDPRERCYECHVIGSSVRSQSLGRGDPTMRAHLYSTPNHDWSHPCIRYVRRSRPSVTSFKGPMQVSLTVHRAISRKTYGCVWLVALLDVDASNTAASAGTGTDSLTTSQLVMVLV